jgi:membrane fusion protein (multidrug efflux system)
MKVSRVQILVLALASLAPSACNMSSKDHRRPAPPITAITVQTAPVTLTEQYVCQVQSYRHIQVRNPESGKLAEILVTEGQEVKAGDLLFKVIGTSDRTIFDTAKSDAENEDKATFILAPFDGVIGRLSLHKGDRIKQGEDLTTLSDNSQVWVYFNVPEARYLQYMAADLDRHRDDLKIELALAGGTKFDQPGKLGAIGSQFNTENGNITFRADFPNPDHLLRQGQTGAVSISRVQNDAIVIPQDATFELGTKRYVYVVDKDDVAHQREIGVQSEQDDRFVVNRGLAADDKIVLGGLTRVQDGDKVVYQNRQPDKVVASTKHGSP